MTPEEKARVKIDRSLVDAGWSVVDRDDYEPTMQAVAVREAIMGGNREADYLLFLHGKAVGVLEAKREDCDITSDKVSEQVTAYARSAPHSYPALMSPLPLLYKANGRDILFADCRHPEARFDHVMRIHTPRDVVRLLGIEDPFAGLPALRRKGLRDCQYEAVTELEKTFRAGQRRALMVLATGAGKTYTACLAAYRFLSYTPMRRVLFLVDRNNLGRQAENEFGTFRLTENGEPFNTIFTVDRLHSSKIPKDSNVVISTIQRLFSLLKGDDITDADDDDTLEPTDLTLPGNPSLPPDFFDLIIIDECHRSIYGGWRSVLEYFATARMMGLTATPLPETLAFFNNNRIVNYTLEKSILDGVNVDSRIYRIKTRATEQGGAIREGDPLKIETRYTGKTELVSNRETKAYTGEELNRSIINPSQIKLILQTYKDAVYTEMFADPQREPDFDYLPKTLIFALNEAHATNIVQIAKEVFGRTDDRYVQKITYSAPDSNELIRRFRNDKDFRIAVTCTLVATGTDVKPLEVLIFMRDVASLPLYTQMKGRGVRTIGDEQLRNVTPNAISKDCFFLVDAVGVTEHEHLIPSPGQERDGETITLRTLLEKITHGFLPDAYLRRLAATLARLHHKADEEQRTEFSKRAGEQMHIIAERIYAALEDSELPPYNDVNEPNNERKGLVAPIANHADARKYILVLAAGFVKTLMPGEDELIAKGFSVEEARDTTEAFEEFCQAHRDDIEALRIIYNNDGAPITYAMLRDLENRLKMENNRLTAKQLWNSYAILTPADVRRATTREERESITNIIQLVRYAFRQIARLDTVLATANQYFNLWCGQNQRPLTEEQKRLMADVVTYIASNAACTVSDIREEDTAQAVRFIRAFGDITAANDALLSLFQFIVYHKTA